MTTDLPRHGHEVLVSRRDGVLSITLNRPHRLNALTPPVMTALSHACQDAATDPSVRALVLTGAGRGFCAGVDRSVIADAGAGGGHRLRSQYHAAVATLAAVDKPVVAAVNGPAAGAGLALAAAADVRVCGANARFVGGFLDVGLGPDHGASHTLVRLIGYAGAFELLGLDAWDAPTALSRGLATRIVPGDQLLERAHEVAERLGSYPALAMAATKQLLRQALHSDLATQLEREAATYDLTSMDPECRQRRSDRARS